MLLYNKILTSSMFRRIDLENFRSFTKATLDLGGKGGTAKPYALIYGENGSGKTNLIESVSFLTQSMRTLVIGDDIARQRAILKNLRDVEDGSSILSQSMDLMDRAFEEIEMAASSISICDYARTVKTIGSDTDMRLVYSFIVDGKEAEYELRFSDDGKVVHERLNYFINSRSGRYFEIDGRNGPATILFGNGLFTNRRFKAQMKELVEKFWGNHTFMSILYAEYRRSNREYIEENVRQGMGMIISYLDDIVVSTPLDGRDPRVWPFEPISGTIPSESEHLLDAYEEAIDTFFTRMYTDVGKTYYKKAEKDGNIAYMLMFSKRISGTFREVPATMESTGTRKLLSMMPALLSCVDGSVVFVDELDSGIHDKLIHDLMKEVLPSVKGQMVVTTHNTSLIKDTDPSKVYVIDLDAVGNKDIRSVDAVTRTQKSHNNTTRYLEGMFGGVPYIGMMDLKDISDTLGEKLGRDP